MLSTFIFHILNISTMPGTVVSHANLHNAIKTGTLLFISLGSLANPVDLTESWGIWESNTDSLMKRPQF